MMSLHYEIAPAAGNDLKPRRIRLSSSFLEQLESLGMGLPGIARETELGEATLLAAEQVEAAIQEMQSRFHEEEPEADYAFRLEAEPSGSYGRMMGGVFVGGEYGILSGGPNECRLLLGVHLGVYPLRYDREVDLRGQQWIGTDNLGRISIVKIRRKELPELKAFAKLSTELRTVAPDSLMRLICG